MTILWDNINNLNTSIQQYQILLLKVCINTVISMTRKTNGIDSSTNFLAEKQRSVRSIYYGRTLLCGSAAEIQKEMSRNTYIIYERLVDQSSPLQL